MRFDDGRNNEPVPLEDLTMGDFGSESGSDWNDSDSSGGEYGDSDSGDGDGGGE